MIPNVLYTELYDFNNYEEQLSKVGTLGNTLQHWKLFGYVSIYQHVLISGFQKEGEKYTRLLHFK